MSEHLEVAKTGRARCKLCKEPIAQGALRLGITTTGFAFDGDMTSWQHAICGAGRRAASMVRALKALKGVKLDAPTKGVLDALSKHATKHRIKRYVWRHPTKERCLVELAGDHFALFTTLEKKHLVVEGSLDDVLASVPDEDFEAAVIAAKGASAATTRKKPAAAAPSPSKPTKPAAKKKKKAVVAKKKKKTVAKKKKKTRR